MIFLVRILLPNVVDIDAVDVPKSVSFDLVFAYFIRVVGVLDTGSQSNLEPVEEISLGVIGGETHGPALKCMVFPSQNGWGFGQPVFTIDVFLDQFQRKDILLGSQLDIVPMISEELGIYHGFGQNDWFGIFHLLESGPALGDFESIVVEIVLFSENQAHPALFQILGLETELGCEVVDFFVFQHELRGCAFRLGIFQMIVATDRGLLGNGEFVGLNVIGGVSPG